MDNRLYVRGIGMFEIIYNIGAIIMAISSFVFLGILIWAVVQFVSKRNKKKPLIGMGICAGIFILALGMDIAILGLTEEGKDISARIAMENAERERIQAEKIALEAEEKELQQEIEEPDKIDFEAITQEEEIELDIAKEDAQEIKADSYSSEVTTSKEVKEEQEKDVFRKGLTEYERGNYPYITTSDLNRYHANMAGVSFCTVTEIDDIKDGAIQSNIGDGYIMSNFHMIENYEDMVKEGDVVAIIGTISQEYTSYGFVGKSLEAENCMLLAIGTDAEAFNKGKSDEVLNEYFVITEEVANSNVDLTEEEFKEICQVLNYTDILRNPDSYEDMYCKVQGQVNQIVEGWFGSYTIYIKDNNGNVWGCTYIYDEGETHLLEDDYVTIYGKCNGTATVNTVLNKQVILPHVSIEYIEF